MIGPDMFVEGQNHNYERVDIPKWQQGMRPHRKTTIGNNVWIGREVYLANGISIGDGSVIAARSVVVKDVPPFSVVGGNPARVIKQYDFKEKCWKKSK